MTDTRLLGRARADLAALPDLVDTLARCLTERPADTAPARTSRTGSQAPLRLDVVHLTDTRRKPDWDGTDPRAQDLTDRHSVVAVLESWTRVVAEELPDFPELAEHATVRTEASVLVEHWNWITGQQWADELAEDVTRITRQVRQALGERREYTPRCRELHCGWRLTPMDNGTWYSCTGCGRDYTLDADLKALGELQTATLAEISDLLGIPVKTLHRWHKEGAISPAPEASHRQRGRLFEVANVRVVATRMARQCA